MVAEICILIALRHGHELVSLATFGLGCVLSLFVIFLWVAILAVHVLAIIMALNGNGS